MNHKCCLRAVLALAAAIVAGCQAAGTHDNTAPAADKRTGTLHPRVKIETSLGDITLELDAEKAPLTVLNFLRYADAKFYDGTVFHRVIKDYLIQGGGHLPSMEEKTEGVGEPIYLEAQNGLSNVRGAIAMGRKATPRTATTQFFINLADNSQTLDYPQPDGHGYAVFGKVVAGIETIDKIAATAVGPHPKYAAGRLPLVPVTPVVIKSVRRIGPFDRAKAQALADAVEAEHAREHAEARKTNEQRLEEMVERLEGEGNAKFVKTESGLMYLDRRVGKGPRPTLEDDVMIHYVGVLLDGTEFESSFEKDPPPTYKPNGLIQGLQETLTTMNEGGKRIVIVPPELAYGAGGIPGKIPPNSTIVYEIELLEIK